MINVPQSYIREKEYITQAIDNIGYDKFLEFVQQNTANFQSYPNSNTNIGSPMEQQIVHESIPTSTNQLQKFTSESPVAFIQPSLQNKTVIQSSSSKFEVLSF